MLYREKTPVHTSFLQFLPSSEAKNASRKSPKCHLGETYKQQNNLFTADEACCRRQHVGLQGLKGSVFAMFSRRKPLEIGSDSTEMWVKILYRKKYTVHPYNLTSLQPYIITFSFSTSPFRPFALSQSSKQHPKNEARSDAEQDFRSSSAPRKRLEKFFQRTKSDLCGKQKPPRCPFSDKY